MANSIPETANCTTWQFNKHLHFIELLGITERYEKLKARTRERGKVIANLILPRVRHTVERVISIAGCIQTVRTLLALVT